MEYNGENIKEMLQDAALKDDVTILRALLGQDPLLLHRPSNVHPLHISSRLGHLQFTEELLRINPSLAEELDPIDKSSPLHLASGNGHVDVVKALVSANTCMCVARDVHGRNPAHVAAMKGHVLVLEELIRAVPAAARERVGGRGESIMHLCVMFNQIEALSLVASEAGAYAEMLLNATDGDANTILHIAVADKRLELQASGARQRNSATASAKPSQLVGEGGAAWDVDGVRTQREVGDGGERSEMEEMQRDKTERISNLQARS